MEQNNDKINILLMFSKSLKYKSIYKLCFWIPAEPNCLHFLVLPSLMTLFDATQIHSSVKIQLMRSRHFQEGNVWVQLYSKMKTFLLCLVGSVQLYEGVRTTRGCPFWLKLKKCKGFHFSYKSNGSNI